MTHFFKGLLRLDIGFGRNVSHFSLLDADAFEKRADTTFTALDTGQFVDSCRRFFNGRRRICPKIIFNRCSVSQQFTFLWVIIELFEG